MSKKIQSVLSVALILLCGLCLFTSCSTQKLDFFTNIGDSLDPVAKLVRAMHGWIGNYGWTVVVFTVFLKVVMLPLDFWQRYASRKATLKNKKMQPLLAAIDKRYGANTQRSQEEKAKLYKKNGGSGMGGMCLPMIVSMAVFFVMFGGLRDYSNYLTVKTFKQLSHTYYDTCLAEFRNDADHSFDADIADFDTRYAEAKAKDDSEGNATLKVKMDFVTSIIKKSDGNATLSAKTTAAAQVAIAAVQQKYGEIRESWLWIQNVGQPDTWQPIMPSFNDSGDSNSFATIVNKDSFSGGKELYNTIRNAVLQTGGYGANGSWNGLLILPILSIALSFLSMFISQKIENRNRKGDDTPQVDSETMKQQQMTNKSMMIIMPLMMAYFGFLYTGAFAIYMVCNYTISILSTVALRTPVEKVVIKSLEKQEQKDNSGKASYMR